MSDEQFDPIAAMDQALRAVQDMAKTMRTYHQALYHQALIAEGFTAAEALALTVAWQAAVVAQSKSE